MRTRQSTRSVTLAAAAAAFALAALAGCSQSEPQTAPGSATPTPNAAAPSAGTPTTPAPATSAAAGQSARNAAALAAIATAETSVPDGTAFDIDLGHDGWDVKVLVGNTVHEVRVSEDGAKVVRTETERADVEDRTRARSVKVPIATAIEKALESQPGDLVEAALTRRGTTVAWEVEINVPPKKEIYLDVATGALLS